VKNNPVPPPQKKSEGAVVTLWNRLLCAIKEGVVDKYEEDGNKIRIEVTKGEAPSHERTGKHSVWYLPIVSAVAPVEARFS